jgi:hypothetical protein
MFPSQTIVQAITDDRLRTAETERLARSVTGERSPSPRRRRRRPLRAVARIALSALR